MLIRTFLTVFSGQTPCVSLLKPSIGSDSGEQRWEGRHRKEGRLRRDRVKWRASVSPADRAERLCHCCSVYFCSVWKMIGWEGGPVCIRHQLSSDREHQLCLECSVSALGTQKGPWDKALQSSESGRSWPPPVPQAPWSPWLPQMFSSRQVVLARECVREVWEEVQC